jgi:phosphoenolpyruvate carboxykinase (ATP)
MNVLDEIQMKSHLSELLHTNSRNLLRNVPHQVLIRLAVERKEAIVTENGALAVWTTVESTGRSPKDTVIVKHPASQNSIDWNSPNNIPLAPEVFDMVWEDAIAALSAKDMFFVNDFALGADISYALPVKVITDKALTALFADNMFRDTPKGIEKSLFYDYAFTLVALPHDKLDRSKYKGLLRTLPDGKTSNLLIAIDFDRKIGLVFGSAYCGSVKKLMFTVMNYYLPEKGILPLHCSANEGKNGDCALLLGLSGTGKTTLSADPDRALLGDDEHGWDENGIANFENGCYAKLINLDKEKEPEIYKALFHKDDFLEHGAIIENAMLYPNGKFDLDDERLTPNSRGSYPLSFLSNIKKSSCSGHPKTILFLTADANGVLPPISKLTPDGAMLWFMMGYTSKLAGTETGIIEPESTFSRFFGGPFMPRNPQDYATLLGEKMKKHNSQVFLVNTGWSGGSFGIGKRMDINLTRALVEAALSGKLDDVEFAEDKRFHVFIPQSISGIDSTILNPENTWQDKNAFEARANKLASDFSTYFDKAYGNKNIPDSIRNQCPGK